MCKIELIDNLLADIRKFELPLLCFNRVLYLLESLETNKRLKTFIRNDMIHLFDYSLSNAHSLSSDWKISFPETKPSILKIDDDITRKWKRLNYIKSELNAIQIKIYQLQF